MTNLKHTETEMSMNPKETSEAKANRIEGAWWGNVGNKYGMAEIDADVKSQAKETRVD